MNRWRTASPNAVGLLLAVAASWLLACTAAPEEPAEPTAPGTSSLSPAPPVPRLTLDLRRVEGKRVSGRRVRPARLRPAAQAVTRVMTELYATGFVDPDAWDDGRFPTLDRLFSLRTRPRVHRDLAALTIGGLARGIDSVRPGRSTIGVRFLVGRRPFIAVASVRFRGTAIGDGVELPVQHIGLVHAAPPGRPLADLVVRRARAASHRSAICTRRSAGPPPRPGSRPPGRSSSS